MKREIQLWSSTLVKQVTDSAQRQREFFVIGRLGIVSVTRRPFNRGKLQ